MDEPDRDGGLCRVDDIKDGTVWGNRVGGHGVVLNFANGCACRPEVLRGGRVVSASKAVGPKGARMTFRYRGFRVVVSDSDCRGRRSASYLFDPMSPGARCVSTTAATPSATARLVCQYIDELYVRERQEVWDQLVAR